MQLLRPFEEDTSSDMPLQASAGLNIGRPKLLFVTLKSEIEVTHLLSVAKELRNVSDEQTKKNVYINAHLSREENFVLYARRQARKKAGHRPKLVPLQTSEIYIDALASVLNRSKPISGGGNYSDPIPYSNTCTVQSS